uniref:Uncharacterized protein ORF109 n=1 Tax=Nothoceros aenigmaticus TaxID=13813 RepID=C3RYQ2_9EMBR|nr:hypothetical protein MeaeMp51 [Nothoceros aenigmaticus]ACC86808.1 hypothetical protein MeaeMp51 [Nothoceros aenigmaticus]
MFMRHRQPPPFSGKASARKCLFRSLTTPSPVVHPCLWPSRVFVESVTCLSLWRLRRILRKATTKGDKQLKEENEQKIRGLESQCPCPKHIAAMSVFRKKTDCIDALKSK